MKFINLLLWSFQEVWLYLIKNSYDTKVNSELLTIVNSEFWTIVMFNLKKMYTCYIQQGKLLNKNIKKKIDSKSVCHTNPVQIFV